MRSESLHPSLRRILNTICLEFARCQGASLGYFHTCKNSCSACLCLRTLGSHASHERDQSKPLLDLLQNAGAIVPGTEQGLSEDELTKRMQADGQSFARENGI